MAIAPLKGRRVLDLGALCAQRPHGIAAAMAAKLCAAYGAEVVRPLPPGGEPLANHQPLLPDSSSALDRFLNTGKRRIPAAGRFDVAIGDDAALRDADAMVKVRLSVFGLRDGAVQDPPMSELGLLALSGLLGIVGEAEGPPARLAGHQAAYASGLAATTALLAALRGGGEELIDISLFDVTTWLNWKVAAGTIVSGTAPRRGGDRVDWFTMPAKDGHIALVYQEKDWPPLRDLVGDPRLHDERFATRPGRRIHRPALKEILGPWFLARTRAEITAAAQARRVPIGPVVWPLELLEDAQHKARGFIAPSGMPALPVGWDGQRVSAEESTDAA